MGGGAEMGGGGLQELLALNAISWIDLDKGLFDSNISKRRMWSRRPARRSQFMLLATALLGPGSAVLMSGVIMPTLDVGLSTPAKSNLYRRVSDNPSLQRRGNVRASHKVVWSV